MVVKNEWIIVKHSLIHGKGIYTRKDIPKHTKIIEYVGEKITKAEADKRGAIILEKSKNHTITGGVYTFELNKRYDIDGNVLHNPAKYINHSCHPNCETYNERGRIWIESIKPIKKGEELSYNYGYKFDEDYHEHPCKCGSANCVGYILDKKEWPKLKRYLQKRKVI